MPFLVLLLLTSLSFAQEKGSKPLLTKSKEREEALFANAPAVFNIEERSLENAPGFNLLSPVPKLNKTDEEYLEIKKRYLDRIVNDVLIKHQNCVSKIRSKYKSTVRNSSLLRGVDPKLVEAILLFERCYRDNYLVKIDYFFGKYRVTEERGVTIPPMNIHRKWAKLFGYYESDLLNPEYNIDLATEYIGRIQERLDDPSVTKLASLYNFIGREYVSFYGLVIEEIYNRLSRN